MSPAGNDATAASAELQAKLGAPPNGEEHIKQDAARWPRELHIANKMRIDEEATEAFDEAVIQDAVGDDREVLGHAVHGKYLVVVSAGADGTALKQAFPLADLDGGAKAPARTPSGGRRVGAR